MLTAPFRRRPSIQSEFPFARPSKKHHFLKGLAIFSLLMVGGAFAFLKFSPTGQKIVPIINAVNDNRKDPDLLFKQVGTTDGHVNVLLIGGDRNWKIGKVYDPTTKQMRSYPVEDNDTRPRSDTMILASFDQNTRQVRLLSIPRDTRVRYRDFNGQRHEAGKLNAVYAQPDGEKLLPKVFQDELGVRIDRTAEIKLDGFTKLIDSIGGIDLNVEGGLFNGKRERMHQTDKWGGWSVDLMPGFQHLTGEQAHGYVRYRKDNEGDPGRVRRQQQVMRELAKQMMHVAPWKLPGMVTELQKQFNTSMNQDELVSAAMFAHSLNGMASVSPLTPYGIYAPSGGDIILNRPQNEKLFAAIFGKSFNKKNFLPLSPETKRDDIGARNNNNPAALSVLRSAGLAKAEKKHNGKVEAPGLQ